MSPLLLAVVLSIDGGASPDGGPRGARSPDGGRPPRGLACLTTWYAGTVIWQADAGGWALSLGDAGIVPWDDSAADRPAAPDDEGELPPAPTLHDLYRTPYQAGAIVPVDTSDAGPIEDPGRVRIEQLFRATYGASRQQVSARLAKVGFFGTRWPFHERAAEPLRRVVARLEEAVAAKPKLKPFLLNIGGTFSWRKIARSPNLSTHAYGIAIDLNVERAHYWRWQRRGTPLTWQNKIPQEIVDAFEAEGFIWGGRWVHFDTMHFEFRPELLSPACAP